MKRRLLKTMAAVLAIAAAAAGPVRGQNSTTYNVTFGGFNEPDMNTTVNVASLPHTFTGLGDYSFVTFTVISEDCDDFTSASVTSGGEGKVSANMPNSNQMTITVTGTFEGTATIHVTGLDDNENPISSDITVACVVAPTPHTVRMAAGTEEAANWTLASGNASVPGNQVLENVMSGSQVTATYNGTTKKVKSVKAVKYVPPAATVTTAPTATEAYIAANSTSALVNAGAANGGTMMYAVTTTNAQPASTADFSATIPTAEGRTAGTYYVWYYAKADADHSDSEIAGPVSVTVTSATNPAPTSASIDAYTGGAFAWSGGETTATVDVTINTFAAGDKISILSANNNNVQFTTSAGGASATFSGTATDDSKFYAVYPYTAGLTLSGDVISGIVIPTSQWNSGWNSDSEFSGWDPKAPIAYATTTGSSLTFHNACAILKVTFIDAGVYGRFTISANEPLAGTFSLDTSTGTLTPTSGSTTVTVGNPSDIYSGINSDFNGKTVYVAIAPGTYTGFNLHIYNEDDDEISKTKSTSVTFEAGKIYDLGSYDLGNL